MDALRHTETRSRQPARWQVSILEGMYNVESGANDYRL